MPYASNDELPESVKQRPKAEQDRWRAVFNAVYPEHGEAAAFKAANAAIEDRQAREPRRDRLGTLIRQYELSDTGGRLKLFPRGTFEHPEYGALEFDDDFFEELKANFDKRVLGQTLPFVDIDHSEGAAAAWIHALSIEPDGMWATEVEWTPLGREAIATGKYRYFSPWFGPYTDPESGTTYDRVLRGGGLTNVPFLKILPKVELFDPAKDRAALERARRRGLTLRLSELRLAEGDLEDLPMRVRSAFGRRYPSNPWMPSPWVMRVFDDYVIASIDEGRGTEYVRIPWAMEGAEIVFDVAARRQVREAWIDVEEPVPGLDSLAEVLATERRRRVIAALSPAHG